MNMESNRDLGRKQLDQAMSVLFRYALTLVVVYVGFVIMIELMQVENESVVYIEIGLAISVMVFLGLVIFKTLKGLRLLKKKEEWR